MAIRKAHDKYNYKEQDLSMFNKILKKFKDKPNYYLNYFIITNKNYYVYAYDEGYKVLKYNKENKSFNLLVDLKNCSDLKYFHER